MASYISTIPLWVIVLFIPSFLYCIALIANPVKQAALNAGMTADRSRNIQFSIFGFYIIYFAYVSILSLKGVFYINSIPPKIVVFTTIPLAIILFVIIGNTRLFKKLLRSITLESLIAIHVFRLVGAFFIILYCYHLLPAGLAFSSGIGDIITALLALPLAKMVSKGKSWSIKAVYAWNIFGILDIVSLLIIAVITTIKSISSGERGALEMTIFPFVWFPAFAPATILFLHTVIFRKLQQIKTT
ncbi:hypothetical protein CLV51_105117 [Chitinophaga niastensis]|uniref:Uncharacterized protein n=1 Tax=Chitinophaga niastensis TaxID=536980 RepID=A0A2P8HEW8_CHINA|nr:hypothetical protein [Chitinophaga niastensis]PSL44745.1 hypothetical protein CLV51_105117 [Chitinophaga niastensis]